MIVIAAGGLSSRFRKAGYQTPKFMLPLGPGNHFVFDEVLDGFRAYHGSEAFIAASRPERGITEFLAARFCHHGIKNFHVAPLSQRTGMIGDVCAAIRQAPYTARQPLTISVADIFRPGFAMPQTDSKTVTVDFGLRAGHIFPARPGFLAAVRCADGLGAYHMADGSDFVSAFEKSRAPRIRRHFNEKAQEIAEAIACVSHLRLAGYRFTPRIVAQSAYVHCGRPDQYERLVARGRGLRVGQPA